MEVMIDLAFFAPRWAVKSGSPRDRRHSWRPSAREFGRFSRAVAERYSGRFADPRDRARNLPGGVALDQLERAEPPGLPTPSVGATRPRPGLAADAAARGEVLGAPPPRTSTAHAQRRLRPAEGGEPRQQGAGGGLAAEAEPGRGARAGIGPLRFTRELACVDASLRPLRRRDCRRFRPLRADGFAHHPYSRATAPAARDLTKDRVQIGELDRLSGLLGELHRRGRLAQQLPIYITEYGYETNPPDPSGHTPEDHARYLGEATYLAWQRPDVRMFAQFLLEDIGPDTSRPPGSTSRWAEYQTGLYHHDGRAKRSVVQGFRLPFFVEQVREPSGALHTVAFGQVRPGSRPQRVLIQRRLGPDRWIVESSLRLLRAGLQAPACNEFPTGPDGFFQRRLPVRGGGTYRFAWTDGDRLVRFSQEVTVGAPRLLVGGLGAVVRGPG